MQTPSQLDAAVIIGRWQLFHKGHETLLQAALERAPLVIVVIGSAMRARDVRNPFDWQERQAMILAGLTAEQAARLRFVPVRDYFDDARWNAAVRSGVEALVPHGAAITLIGFKKDASSYYLDHFGQWAWHGVEPDVEVDATALRDVYFSTPDASARAAVLAPYVSAPVLAYLQAWAHLPLYAERATEHAVVAAYKKRWTADVYLTADAVLVARQHVLLVRRGGDVGHGQWALPGGFVDKGERLYDACLRELQEETGFKTLAATMQHAFKGSHLFDHPLRSPRGRLITCAFHFDLGDVRLPEIAAADDAAEARWVPVSELPALETELFEDHAVILDRFIDLHR